MPTLAWIGKEKVINYHMDVLYRCWHMLIDSTMINSKRNRQGNKISHGNNREALKSRNRKEGTIAITQTHLIILELKMRSALLIVNIYAKESLTIHKPNSLINGLKLIDS